MRSVKPAAAIGAGATRKQITLALAAGLASFAALRAIHKQRIGNPSEYSAPTSAAPPPTAHQPPETATNPAFAGPSGAAASMSTSTADGGHPSLRDQLQNLQPHPGMARLVRRLIDRGTVRTPEVARVMSLVDRAEFVQQGSLSYAYEDHPVPIGYGQTISAPHMHATALELLSNQLRPGARVLDVGSGSGYLTACLGLLVAPGGRVLGVEVVPQLAARSLEALRRTVPGLMADGTITVEAGNVLTGLLATQPSFDAIHVGAAAEELPMELVEALAPGGRMVVPVGPHGGYQVLTVVDKRRQQPHRRGELAPQGPTAAAAEAEVEEEGGGWSGGIRVTPLMSVGYVPLVRDE